MSFKRKTAAEKNRNQITLVKITNGCEYTFNFDPSQGPKGNLARFIREFDDEGFPLFFANEKIAGLPVRVRDGEIDRRVEHYIGSNEKNSRAAKHSPVPAKIAQKADEITRAVKKATSKKAAGAAKKSKPKQSEAQNVEAS